MDKLELQEKRSHAALCMKDIQDRAEKEGRATLTKEEMRQIDDYHAEVQKWDAEIEAMEVTEKYRSKINDTVSRLQKREDRQIPPQKTTNSLECERIETRGYRCGALKAFKKEEDAYRSGVWVRAALLGDNRAQRIAHDIGISYRSHSEGSNTAGGAIVPDEMAMAIIDLREQYGVFRRYARVIPMGRDTLTISRRTGGLTAYFTGEGVEITESEKSWNNVNLTARKLACLSKISTELDEDAFINIGDDLANEMAYAFALKEDQCGFIGTGSDTYGGIVGIAKKLDDGNSGTLLGSVDPISAATGIDTFAEVTQTDVVGVMAVLPEYARANAKFYCSRACADVVFGRLAAAAGGNTIQTVQGGYGLSYLGHEIVVSQVLASTLSTINNTHMFLFGDLSLAATMGDRRGITVARTADRYFETDEIGIKATERVDIVIHDVGTSAVAGPMVALIGKTS